MINPWSLFAIKMYILYLVTLNIVVQIQTLEVVPKHDQDIAITETAIRNTVNRLFAALKIQDVKHRPRLRQFSIIHNYFVSITLTDCENLKEIQKLSQVEMDDNATHFITNLNEVLNEIDNVEEPQYDKDVYVTNYIDTFIRRLKFLKETYVSNKNTAISGAVLKYLEGNHKKTIANITKAETNYAVDNVLGENEFWEPHVASGRRIFQGTRTKIKTFPFMASVHFFKSFHCAGSIIKDDLVLTSSSCLQLVWNNRFFRENPAFLSVRVGCDFFDYEGDNIGVLEVYFHPQYDPKLLKNNIAIVRLTRKLNLRKYRRVKKINFDTEPSPLALNPGKITVLGWGAKDSTNMLSLANKLSYALLDYYPLSSCQEHYSKDYVTEKNFCAGFISKAGGACNHDAGGPGVIDGVLTGVVSFGSPVCGASGSPTVFTKVGFYADWIENIVEMDVPNRSVKTTKSLPRSKYNLDNHHHTKTTMTLTPLTTPDSLYPITPKHITEYDTLRMAQDEEFQDFLTAMFSGEEAAEIQEDVGKAKFVNDAIKDITSEEMVPNKIDKPDATRERYERIKPVTEGIYDSDSGDDDKSVIEDAKKISIDDSKDKRDYGRTADKYNSDTEKLVEDHIVKLIDNLDFGNLLQLEKHLSLGGIIQFNKNNYVNADEIKHDVARQSKVEFDKFIDEDIKIELDPQEELSRLFVSKDDKNDVSEGLSIQVEQLRGRMASISEESTERFQKPEPTLSNLIPFTALVNPQGYIM